MSEKDFKNDMSMHCNLTKEDYSKIEQLLERKPTETEINVFDALWSEHISHKNSYKWLKTLPTEGNEKTRVHKSGFTDTGIIETEDLVLAVKINSYNHPSAFDPSKGATSAIAIANRQLYTTGIPPVAVMSSLRLGNAERLKTKETLYAFVQSLTQFTDKSGVPMITSDLKFDSSYNENPLINIISIGVSDKTIFKPQINIGDKIILIGDETVAEGIQGTTFASAEITEKSGNFFPRRVADPVTEKSLTNLISEGVQQQIIKKSIGLDTAGLINAIVNILKNQNCGLDADITKVALQNNLSGSEALLSETPCRLLVIIAPDDINKLNLILEKQNLKSIEIGHLTADKKLEIKLQNQIILNIPISAVTVGEGSPIYHRSYSEDEAGRNLKLLNINNVSEPANLHKVAASLVKNPNICSKNWIAEQFDTILGNSTMSTNLFSNAKILQLQNTQKALVLHTSSNSKYIQADPAQGAAIAIAQAVRSVSCAGGTPIAATVGMNFGSPDNALVFNQFVETLNGLGQACRKFKIPLVGNNISFFNQTVKENTTITIEPTPIVAVIGLIENTQKRITQGFKQKGDMIFLIGENHNDISSSEYLVNHHRTTESPTPFFDLTFEVILNQTIKQMIDKELIRSAHPVSEGGLFISLFESSVPDSLGFDVTTDSELRPDAFLFGESQGRVLVSVSPSKEAEFIDFMMEKEMPTLMLGHVTKGEMRIDEISYGFSNEVAQTYKTTLEKILNK